MPGIAELMYGGALPPAQAYAVPDPGMGIADILAGGSMNAPTAVAAPMGGIATAYGDSPAPGAVAAAGAQANAAAAQEPGILDKARGWAAANPGLTNALMQGFGALASGQTRGGALTQLGQASSVANQTMVEQQAANNAQALAAKTRAEDFGLRTQETQSQIDNRNADNKRADALLPGQVAGQAATVAGANERVAASKQLRGQSEAMFTPKMEEAKLKLQTLRQQIASTTDDQALQKLKIQEAKLNLGIHQQFAPAQAQAVLDTALAKASGAQEQATQEVLQTDEAVRKAEALRQLTPEQQTNYTLGIKPKEHKTPTEIAMELNKLNPDLYRNKDGSINLPRLQQDVNAQMNVGNPKAQGGIAEWTAARNKVKVGQRYIGPDGQEYTRNQ